MYVDMDQDADMNEIIHRLTKVYGIKSISPVIKTDKTEEAIYEAAIQLARDFDEGSTFKIDVKRVDKSFHLDTYALQREVGGAILKNVEGVSVNVKQPDHEVRVEIRLDAVYIFEKIIQGSGGTCRNWWQDVTNVKWRYRFTGGRYGSNETWGYN